MSIISFRSFVLETVKKFKIPTIDGWDIGINDTVKHSFVPRYITIKDYYQTLEKEKHEWLKDLTLDEVIENIQEKITKVIIKLTSVEPTSEVNITVYFKKSKFIGVFVIIPKTQDKLNTIILKTIGTYEYKIFNSKKTQINEVINI